MVFRTVHPGPRPYWPRAANGRPAPFLLCSRGAFARVKELSPAQKTARLIKWQKAVLCSEIPQRGLQKSRKIHHRIPCLAGSSMAAASHIGLKIKQTPMPAMVPAPHTPPMLRSRRGTGPMKSRKSGSGSVAVVIRGQKHSAEAG